MDINSQQLVNTFVGGMNTDTSDALLESNQYRYAENLRLFTNTDSNSGELRLVDGTEEKYVFENGTEILKLDKVRDIVTVITRKNNMWSVYLYKSGLNPTLLFGPCPTPIWENNEYPNLSTVLNYEADDNIKLYIADGIHQIMTLKFSENINTSLGSNIYKLLPKIDKALPKIDCFVITGSGNITGYRVLYFYRLYQQYGPATSLSSSSQVLSLYKNLQNGYETASSGNSVQVTISLGNNFDFSKFNRIQIFRVAYVQNGLLPKIDLINDKLASGTVTYNDDGTNIRSLSVSEFLAYEKTEIVPILIETKNNYLFASNLKYTQDQIDEKFKDDFGTTEKMSRFFDSPTITQGEQYLITDLQLDNRYLNDSLYSGQETTYRPGEKYRFGIIFYDTEGNKSSVFPLGDIDIPELKDITDWDVITPISNGAFVIKPININIRQKLSLPSYCSKYEIVRCIRTINDKRTISQGLLGRPMETFKYENNGSQSLYKLTPSGFITMNLFSVLSYTDGFINGGENIYGQLSSSILLFASPELVYLPDDMLDILKLYENTIKVRTVAEYIPKLYIDQSTKKITTREESQPENSNNAHPVLLRIWEYPVLVHTELYSYTKSHQVILSTPYFSNTGDNRDGLVITNSNDSHQTIAFNVISPYYVLDTNVSDYTISDIAYVDSPEWNLIGNGETLRFKDDITTIDKYTYIGWSNPFNAYYSTGSESPVYKALTGQSCPSGPVEAAKWYNAGLPIGSTGRCILMKSSSVSSRYYNNTSYTGSNSLNINNNGRLDKIGIATGMGPFVITVADIRKTTIPYGDGTNNTYCSFGDVFNPSVGDKIISSGDCYIRLFKYNALHNWYHTTFNTANKMGTVYLVPIFTDIDLHGDYGVTYNRNLTKGYYIQDKASAFDGYIQNKDAYLYNTAYNQHPDVIQYSKYDGTIVHPSKYGARVHYSAQKTNNELIDSWTNFQSMNFLDTDYRFGDITELKLFRDRLMFWQEHAFGMLAVNERVVLNDANDTQVVLGTGSVLDRYDYISTVYGMKLGQHTACVSNDALYWWDSYNKEILQYVDKSSLIPLTQAKNIRNYINSSSENEHPHIYYNSKYKEVVCSCVNNQSVAYNELLLRFTSVYTSLTPVSSVPVNDQVYLAYGRRIDATKATSGDTSYTFGNSITPRLKYIVNHNNTLTKTFDIQIIGGKLYNTNDYYSHGDQEDTHRLYNVNITYTTPLKQEGRLTDGQGITDREYDFRLDIPRAGKETDGNPDGTKPKWETSLYGDRLRGKTMQCELWSTTNSTDFSLQYITTKYRMSWS